METLLDNEDIKAAVARYEQGDRNGSSTRFSGTRMLVAFDSFSHSYWKTCLGGLKFTQIAVYREAGTAVWSTVGIAMIECKELNGKVVKKVTVYPHGDCGPEVNLEFTDGSVFNVCLTTGLEAKLTLDEGGEPSVLQDYTREAFS